MSTRNVLVIAEIGVNHNGDLGLARQMADAAAATGADVVKFQTFTAGSLQIEDAPKAEYQKATTGVDSSATDMIVALELGRDDFIALRSHVEAIDVEFLSTAFDLDSVRFLAEGLGLRRFKVPSGEITNLPYLRLISELADEVIISTGMSEFAEVEAAVAAVEAAGTPRERIIVLQCNTSYPSPVDDANLLAMVAMGQRLGTRWGYSDHTQGAAASIAAVALGAVVIEKHFTTDRALPGPDQAASMEPADFTAMVTAIREVERALGSAEKTVTTSERENRPIARRGVYAARDLPAGHALSASDLVCLRPENGTSPMDIDSLVGRVLAADVPRHGTFGASAFAGQGRASF